MLKYEHLIGLKFEFGERDCLSLVRDFYADNFGIQIPNYARPEGFWEKGMDMYHDLCPKNGFYLLDCHPSEYQPADLVIMSIRASVGNHAGILVEKGKMIHHLWGGLSKTDSYIGSWRDSTVSIWRHKDVNLSKAQDTVNILDTLTPHTRRRIDAALRSIKETG